MSVRPDLYFVPYPKIDKKSRWRGAFFIVQLYVIRKYWVVCSNILPTELARTPAAGKVHFFFALGCALCRAPQSLLSSAFPSDRFGLGYTGFGFRMPDPSSLLAGTARQGRERPLIPVLKAH
jgi:hypothetical protein